MHTSHTDNQKNVEINAVGKILSQQNASRIANAIKTMIELLADSQTLAELDLGWILEKAETLKKPIEASTGESSLDPLAERETTVVAEASRFKRMVESSAWGQRLQTVMRFFEEEFQSLHSRYVYPGYRVDVTPEQKVDAYQHLTEDLNSVLRSLHEDALKFDEVGIAAQSSEDLFSDLLKGAITAQDTESGIEIKAEGAQLFAFDCPIQLEASASEDPNRRPIKGVLFRIDEPSEAIPAIGPGLPLYIPSQVAASLVNSVAGLPLDAHDSLDQHANKEIAGVMQTASIAGGDFIVHGILWPWSQNKKVQAISANAKKLGMSMNAIAKGHEATIDNKKVFYIDQLRLMGANILFSKSATYKKTRLIAAQEFVASSSSSSSSSSLLDEENAEPTKLAVETPVGESQHLVAAQAQGEVVFEDNIDVDDDDVDIREDLDLLDSDFKAEDEVEDSTDEDLSDETSDGNTENPIDEGDIDMTTGTGSNEAMDSEIKLQLSALNKTLSETLSSMNNTISVMGEKFSSLEAEVSEIREDHYTRKTALQASQQEQQEREKKEELVQMIEAAVAKQINPSNSPARRTYPVAARATTSGSSGSSDLREKMAWVNGQISAMEALPGGVYDGAKVMQLMDEKRQLEAQIGG
ncbi:MAG: hypothetical protein WBB28_01575 [Crinalium sp.]